MKGVVFLVLFLIGAVFSQTTNSFSCAFTMFSDTKAPYARVLGTMYYSSSEGVRMAVFSTQEKEIYLKNDASISFITAANGCKRFSSAFPELPAQTAAYSTVPSCGASTSQCRRFANGANVVFTSNASYVPVEVDFGDWKFHLGSCGPYTKESLDSYVKNCPAKVCTMMADMVYNCDESGSIGSGNFETFRKGLSGATAQLDIGEKAIKIGVVKFGSTAVQTAQLTASTSIVSTIYNMTYASGGSTATGEGLLSSLDMFSRGRPTAPKILITFTDGGSNSVSTLCKNKNWTSSGTCLSNAINLLNTTYKGMYFMSLGIGGSLNSGELLTLAGGVSSRSLKCDWNQVVITINNMLTQVCTEYNGSVPTCGADCKGYCSATQTCSCPNYCEYDRSTCSSSRCVVSGGNAKCEVTTYPCSSNECYTASCLPNNTCQYSEMRCADLYPAKCVVNRTCSQAKGIAGGVCNYALDCPKSNFCYNISCPKFTKNAPCDFDEKNCLDHDRTTKDSCKNESGCVNQYCLPTNATHKLVPMPEWQGGVYNQDHDRNGTGCVYIEAPKCDPNDGCFNYSVNVELWACEKIAVKNCPDTNTDAKNGACFYSECRKGVCEKVTFECNEPDPCAFCKQDLDDHCITGVECDKVTKTCVPLRRSVPVSNCFSYSCNPANGNIESVPLHNSDPCHECNETTGRDDNLCPPLPCEYQECVVDSKNPKGICVKKGSKCPQTKDRPCEIVYCNPYVDDDDLRNKCFRQDCSDPLLILGKQDSLCYEVKCNNDTLECYKEVIDTKCAYNGSCKQVNQVCDLTTGICLFEDGDALCQALKEDDKCVEFECLNATGECHEIGNRHYPILDESSPSFGKPLREHLCFDGYCRIPSCDPEYGYCSYTEIVCPPEGTEMNPCLEYFNDPTLEGCCASKFLDGQSDDGCGGCQMYPGNCDWLLPVPTAAIGGAVGAAIAVACVIVVVVVGVLMWIGGKKTYDLITKSKEQQMAGANDNPLFQGNEDEFVNPLNQ